MGMNIEFNRDAEHDIEPLQYVSNISDSVNTYTIKDIEARNSIANLANVARSGNYYDLSNKPTIPDAQVQSDWNVTSISSKAYILNKPTIPTLVKSDWN